MDSYVGSVYSAKISLNWKIANILLQTPVQKIAEEK